MNASHIDAAVNAAIKAAIASTPFLADIPVLAALTDGDDTLPQITHTVQVAEDIVGNHTYQVTMAIGVISSANPEEVSPVDATGLATRLHRVLLSDRFAIALEVAGQNSSPRFAVASPPRLTASATVEVADSYTYNQSGTFIFHAQF